jgi:hypothetical protein
MIAPLVGCSFACWLFASASKSASQDTTSAKNQKSVKQSRSKQPPWHENLSEWKALDDPETADNSFCYVCHLNYEEEELTQTHLPMGVGCETCHGISDKHSEDEDSVIPPDVMFPKEQIVRFCGECHAKEDLLGQEEHDELFAQGNKSKKTCADCHAADHRLKVRTRKWNKRTGKLVWDDGVRMMEEAPKR